MKRKVIVWTMLLLFISTLTLADSKTLQGVISTEDVTELSLSEAVKTALANSLELQSLKLDVQARILDQDKANHYRDELLDADEELSDGWQAYEEQSQAYEAGLYKDALDGSIDGSTDAWDSLSETDRLAVELDLKAQLEAAEEELTDNSEYSLGTLVNAQIVDLYTIKAKLGLELTRSSVAIAEQKIALLTKQQYFDVLERQCLAEVKEKAYTRGKQQYQLAKDSYEAGLRAKDEYLLAAAQMKFLKADYQQACHEVYAAELELKQTLGLSPAQSIQLLDDFAFADVAKLDFEADLTQGLAQRLEIKKAQMDRDLAVVNLKLAAKYTAPNTFDYREIELEKEQAELAYEQTKQEVESEIYADYHQLLTLSLMLEEIEGSLAEAEEAADIAVFRYQEGFGLPTNVLKALDSEDAAGTILEVQAYEEKLSQVEEQIVTIKHSYQLAWDKYKLDTAS